VININKIYNQDCIEGMKNIPDNYIDMVLCDLPYGTTQNKWDILIDLNALWNQYKRICKSNAAIILTAQTPFDKILGSSNIEWLRYEYIWVKNVASGFLNSHKMPLKVHENILVFYKEMPTFNPIMEEGKAYKVKQGSHGSNYGKQTYPVITQNSGVRFPKDILYFNKENDNWHPTQKPVALFEYLIRTHSNPSDIILDNCIGSGTTAVACMNTKRNFIGFENDPIYYEKCLERIDNMKPNEDIENKFLVSV